MKAKEKPAYQSPKVSRLNEEESVYGGSPTLCQVGSNADPCMSGNNADSFCSVGSDGDSAPV